MGNHFGDCLVLVRSLPAELDRGNTLTTELPFVIIIEFKSSLRLQGNSQAMLFDHKQVCRLAPKHDCPLLDLRENIFCHFARDVCQAKVSTRVMIGETFVIQAEQVQDRGV